MPNQSNYITRLTDKNVRQMPSRISDDYITLQIPVTAQECDFIEMNFYNTTTDELVYNLILSKDSNFIAFRDVKYSDNTVRTFLLIDFKELVNDTTRMIPVGRFKIVMNLFKTELGSYNNMILSLSTISPSRTELEFSTNTDVTQEEIDEFASPQINSEYIMSAVKQILHSAEVEFSGLIPSNNTTLTYSTVESYMEPTLVLDVERINNTQELKTITQELLAAVYVDVSAQITNILQSGKKRITREKLTELILESLQKRYTEVKIDETVRFNLV